jgi:hypothetical protein
VGPGDYGRHYVFAEGASVPPNNECTTSPFTARHSSGIPSSWTREVSCPKARLKYEEAGELAVTNYFCAISSRIKARTTGSGPYSSFFCFFFFFHILVGKLKPRRERKDKRVYSRNTLFVQRLTWIIPNNQTYFKSGYCFREASYTRNANTPK